MLETPRSNAKALSLLASARYDVIISDVARDDEGPASDMKGVELAEQVYAQWSRPLILRTARFHPATVPNWTAEQRLRLVK